MLRRQDVGHRVVVRRVVGVREDRPIFSDALGELVDLSETELTLVTAHGQLRVPLREVHRAKRVPPAARPSAAAVTAVERAANESWPAPDQERLGAWVLRAAGGWTGRANSALAVGDPDRPLGQAIDAVEAWYRDRNLRPMINVPLPLAAPVNAELVARGWHAHSFSLVQTVALATLLERADASEPTPTPPPVHLEPAPTGPWLDMVGARKGTLPEAARHILTAVDQVRFPHVYDDSGALLAVARASVTGDNRWLGLSLIEVAGQARRQGLARHVIAAAARWAVRLGATQAFLQVEERNTAAVALYGRLGFTTHHTYFTRAAP